MTMKHVIFYDGDCPLCNKAVRFVLATDRNKVFQFAPLKGKTADEKLSRLFLKNPDLDTLVLLQNYNTSQEKLLIEGKGALRILWLLGFPYSFLGVLSFLPPLFDPLYRLIARNRFRLFTTSKPLPSPDNRFLP
jgi:predicted DCC family thiol-disulfide oxidoreductase YuxK